MKKARNIIVFIFIAILIFIVINRISDPSGTTGEWYASSSLTDYYRKTKNSIDTLYVGSSNIYAGVSPLEIYEKIGVTGYSYASSEQKVWSSYYTIVEALKTQSPKVIFLETSEFFSDKSDQTEQGKRKAIDPLKMGSNKIEMMNDPIYEYTAFDKASCYIKLLRYHYRWSRLNWSDIEKLFGKQYSYDGYIFDNKIKSYDYDDEKAKVEEENTPINEVQQMPDNVKIYLDKIVNLCKEKDIKLVLLSMPTPKTWSAKKHNEIEKYSNNNNLNFIDLNTDDNISMDWDNDSSDGGIHLNIYGAEKVGDYLTKYILQNYELTDHRDDPEYTDWNDDLERYNDKKGKNKEYVEEYKNYIREYKNQLKEQ